MVTILSWIFLSLAALCLAIAWVLMQEMRRLKRRLQHQLHHLDATVHDVQVLAVTTLDAQQGALLLTQINERMQQGLAQIEPKPSIFH
jgi:hypothetical protein